MTPTLRTAVIPAGGLGTRFLPFSRTVPKELLPLVDTPVIDLIVAECAAAGIERVVLVGAPGKEALRDYFRPAGRLAARLEREGRTLELERARRPEGLAQVLWVVQDEARGNGHAVLVAREAVDGEPFAVLWGDDVFESLVPAVAQLDAVRRARGGSVAGALRIPPAERGRYGMLAGPAVDLRTIRVESIVEKPAPGETTGELGSVHGYVLQPSIFEALAECPPGRGGEIWLADAVARLVGREAVWAYELEGVRYDAGDRAGYATAFLDRALARPDTGPAVRDHLRRAGWHAPGDR